MFSHPIPIEGSAPTNASRIPARFRLQSPQTLEHRLRKATRQRRLDIAKRRLAEGIEADRIVKDFIEWGVEGRHAREIVADAVEQRRQDQFRECVQPIWVGGSMLLIGILLVMIGVERSSLADARIHRYLILGVAILPAAAAYAIFGLIQLLSHLPHQRRSAPVEAMKPMSIDLSDPSSAETSSVRGRGAEIPDIVDLQRAAA